MPDTNALRPPLRAAVGELPGVIRPIGPGTISFVGSSLSTGETITLPASARRGDLALLFDVANGPAATVVPTDWVAVGAASGSTFRRQISFRILAGNEGTITGMVGSTSTDKIALVFRRTVGNWGSEKSRQAQVTTSAPTDQVVTVDRAPLIVVGHYAATAGVTTQAFTPAQDAQVASVSLLNVVRYKIYNAPSVPASTTVAMGDNGSNIMTSFYMPLL